MGSRVRCSVPAGEPDTKHASLRQGNRCKLCERLQECGLGRQLPWRTGRVPEVRRECPAEIRKLSSASQPCWVLQLQLFLQSLQGQEGEVEGHEVQPEKGQMRRKLEKEQENKEKVQENLLHG